VTSDRYRGRSAQRSEAYQLDFAVGLGGATYDPHRQEQKAPTMPTGFSGHFGSDLSCLWVLDLVTSTGIIAHVLSKRYTIPFVFDLYDNFDYYLTPRARLPIMKQMHRWVIRKCDAVTCVSKPLPRLISPYGRIGPVYVIENAVRTDLFDPLDTEVCRKEMNLPRSVPVMRTAGAIFRNPGIITLFKAFEKLKPKYPDLRLALAGPRDMEISRLSGIIDLAMLPIDKLLLSLSALDIAVICNRANESGRSCFLKRQRKSWPLIFRFLLPRSEALPICLPTILLGSLGRVTLPISQGLLRAILAAKPRVM
jgi:glycosyltransferase involved in cell wall biosynthesis